MRPTDEQRQVLRMEALVESLRDPKRRRRRQHALESLAWLWTRTPHSCFRLAPWPRIPPSPEALRAVGLCLDDPKVEVRVAAVGALSRCEPHFEEALPFLRAACGDPHPLVRLNAVNALSRLGQHAAGAVPSLRLLLSDSVRTVRWTSAFLLVELAPSEECVPVLVDSLWSRTGYLEGLHAFRRLGPLARPAIPQVLQVLRLRGLDQRDEVLRLLAGLAR